MRKTAVANALLFLVVLVGSAGAASPPDEQIKQLAGRYNQVEGQLDRFVHYLQKEVSGVGTSIEQAWFDGAGDLIKVATEKSDASGRELTEYVATASAQSTSTTAQAEEKDQVLYTSPNGTFRILRANGTPAVMMKAGKSFGSYRRGMGASEQSFIRPR